MRITGLFVCLVALSICSFAQTDAKIAYSQKCAICHGPDGKATTPTAKKMGALDLTSPSVQKLPDTEIRNAIANGKGKMPPYSGILGKDGVEAMVKYVRTLSAK